MTTESEQSAKDAGELTRADVGDSIAAQAHLPSEQSGSGFCDHFIESGKWGGTYCKLLAGHPGEHAAHYPAACGVVRGDGSIPQPECKLVVGHAGPHWG